MALNISRQMYQDNKLALDNLVLPIRLGNQYEEKRGGERCGKKWQCHCSRDVEDRFEFKEDRGGSHEASNDILDMLPSDPFEMDISTTFTAINGWLEDLDYGCYGGGEAGSSMGGYDVFAGFNFFWSSTLRFHSLPVKFGADDISFVSSGLGGDPVKQEPPCSAPCDNIGSNSNLDDILRSLPTDNVFHQTEDDQSVPGAYSDADCDSLHPALFFALGYLGVQDLLSTEGVCKSLRCTVQSDPLLWRNIHIDQPLNEKINDDMLIHLASRAQGHLQSLSLVDCPRITDDGLKQVLESNPRLTKLSVPGCTKLSVEGIVNNLKAFALSNASGVRYLRIGGVSGVSQKHFDELKLLLAAGNHLQQNSQKPHFYGRNRYLSYDDDRSIDIEACPICKNFKLVYDCPNKGCQGGEASQRCRACTFCIQRCIQCGQCINDSVYVENFCLEYVCADCWNQLPKHSENVDSQVVASQHREHDEPSSSVSTDG